MWFDSIAGTGGMAATAGPRVVVPGQPFPAVRAVAAVLGYWYPGDGRRRNVLLEHGVPSPTRRRYCLRPSESTRGRWIRLVEGPVSVKSFGARSTVTTTTARRCKRR